MIRAGLYAEKTSRLIERFRNCKTSYWLKFFLPKTLHETHIDQNSSNDNKIQLGKNKTLINNWTHKNRFGPGFRTTQPKVKY